MINGILAILCGMFLMPICGTLALGALQDQAFMYFWIFLGLTVLLGWLTCKFISEEL
jgi:hypothetical protein